MSKLKYPVVIRPLNKEEGGGYLVEFPDLPGCVADGPTIESALHEAEDALKSWLLTAKKFGDFIPEPTVTNAFSEQQPICLPKSLYTALVLKAKQEGVSLNTLAAVLLAQGIGQNLFLKHHHKKI